MIEAVIFDMDGVIIDSEPDYKQIEMDMYDEMGLAMSEEDAVKSMGRVTVDWWRELKERFGLKRVLKSLQNMKTSCISTFYSVMKSRKL